MHPSLEPVKAICWPPSVAATDAESTGERCPCSSPAMSHGASAPGRKTASFILASESASTRKARKSPAERLPRANPTAQRWRSSMSKWSPAVELGRRPRGGSLAERSLRSAIGSPPLGSRDQSKDHASSASLELAETSTKDVFELPGWAPGSPSRTTRLRGTVPPMHLHTSEALHNPSQSVPPPSLGRSPGRRIWKMLQSSEPVTAKMLPSGSARGVAAEQRTSRP
mmetsp:Transcript_28592/g.68141  ORF Transcript_28592/g.68141 Transcript_28592/m.68141 type:complete len:226 (+) Transcript_28592:672-1349(+)